MSNEDITLEQVQELFDFLQGTVPEDITLGRGHKPRLTRNQAFSVIWYLQEHLGILPDHYEKCHRRGCDSDLYDSDEEGCLAIYCESCAERCPYDGKCDTCPKVEC